MDEAPIFPLTRIFQMRDRLRVQFDMAAGQPLSADALEQLLRRLHQCMPGVRLDTLYESLRHLIGRTLTGEDCLVLAWRLAGNVRLLQTHTPVRPWQAQLADEWVPLQVVGALPGRTMRGKFGHYFMFRALSGTCCPMTLETFWTEGAASIIARNAGFSAPWRSYPYRRSLQLVGLRLTALIEQLRSTRTPRFFQVQCPASVKRWNREQVLRLRCRAGAECPHGFTHSCDVCAVGYAECPAGCHRDTYVQQQCDGCGQIQYFDPERRAVRCVECDNRERCRLQPQQVG
jgi:hypothetical protein